jgi:glutamine amidotransferase
MIAIVDYGVGNLFSLRSSLRHIGAESVVTGDETQLRQADKIILPGVGAFGDAADKLRKTGLFSLLRELAGAGKPLMGICLGMQLLFERSYEFGEHEGLSLVRGDVCPLAPDIPASLKVPHMGWNRLDAVKKDDPLLRFGGDGQYVYYVHSFYAKHCEKSLVATSEYDVNVPGIVREGNVSGCQFHPEKSGEKGLNILRAFAEE